MTSSRIFRSLLLFAASFALLDHSAHAACKTSGQINLRIDSRPSKPDSIGWSGALAAAADTALHARAPNATATNIDNWIGVNFARHHVLPQTWMQALVKITEADNNDVCDRAIQQNILSSLKAIQVGGREPLLTGVAWAPINLFEGPNKDLRSDDPDEGPEPVKPASFDATRWSRLDAVKQQLKKLGAPNGQYFVLKADVLNAQGGLRDLATALSELAKLAPQPNPQPFLASDWVSTSDTRQAINFADLIGYYNNQVNYTSMVSARKYQLKPR